MDMRDQEAQDLIPSEVKPKILAVVGCGPKALAIAGKAKVLNDLGGLPQVRVIIIERYSAGCHWDGHHGFTDGEQILGTPPEKDLGFPYRSVFGSEVDRRMLASYSWEAFQIAKRQYGEWVDKGRKHPRHEQWAQYLQWAFDEIEPEFHNAEVTHVEPKEQAIEVTLDHEQKIYVNGIVFTGPGEPLQVHASNHGWHSENIFHGRNFWQRLPVFSSMKDGNIAVIGAGETAASIVVALTVNAPSLKIDLINRHGTLYTRGESYHENTLYTDPNEWQRLDRFDREDFIRRTDRGVFSVDSKRVIDQAPNLHMVTGNVTDIRDTGRRVIVKLQRLNEIKSYDYNKIVVVIGFDPLSPFNMLPDHLRVAEKLRELKYHVDQHLRIPALDAPSLEGADAVNIHMPMLAGISQGPGFPNLSCLGILANRILSAYIATDAANKR